MRANRQIVTLALLGLAAAGLAVSQDGKKPVNWDKGIPEPFATPSASNRPQVIDRPDGAKLSLPQGFKIEEFATSPDFNRPRYMYLLPNEHILMSDSGDASQANGVVYHLNPDGKQVSKLIEGLDRPFGIQLHEKWLYVAETTSLKRYPFDAKAVKVTGKGEEIYPMPDFGKGHWTRTILFNKDHSKLYLTIGSGSNVDAGEPQQRAALHRMNPDGTEFETVAEGLRNTIGLRFNPTTGKLWASVQERDGLGDDLVSDYLVQVEEGGFYGWPYAYTGPHEDPRRKGEKPDLVKKTLYPDVLLGAHVAVLDMQFYSGKQFPAKYRDGLFLAFHGSWNRADRIGYKVAFIPFKNGQPASGPQDFLTGWMLSPDKRQVWGRPVGLLVLSDGSLLVSDDGGKKVWRISYGG
ncbi:MAG: sorbosone dehydrogenase family protein [Acidobacteria bacterium]|nr:sorbosone dehydrogenase family protein [Acidobacteriota bacterium]